MAPVLEISIILMAIGMPPSRALTDAQVLAQAESDLHEALKDRNVPRSRGLFRTAARQYEVLRLRGVENPRVCCNEGNAYLLAGDLPRAILAYRRGLSLAPMDRELRRNLEYARGLVVHSSPTSFGRPPQLDWPPHISASTSRWLLLLAGFTYAAGWLAFTRWRMSRQNWHATTSLTAFGLTIVCLTLFTLGQWAQRRDERRPLVVIAADGVMLRKGNGELYPPGYDKLLNRGVEARLRVDRGDWLQIELSGGEVGWVPSQKAVNNRSLTPELMR